MKNLGVVLITLLIVAPASAVYVWADADGYANGSDISNVFSGMTLSSVGGYAGLDGQVYAWGDGLASTGTNVFANNLSFQRQWYVEPDGGFGLRADFQYLASYVAIDIIGDDSGDRGVLYAYDTEDILIGMILSPQLDTGEVFTASIDRDSFFDIAYVIAGGAGLTDDTVHLDNLAAIIPEPATLCLIGLGSLFLLKTRQNIKLNRSSK